MNLVHSHTVFRVILTDLQAKTTKQDKTFTTIENARKYANTLKLGEHIKIGYAHIDVLRGE